MILASHNSGTGENPSNLFAKLFSWIAKCQDKCLIDQYMSGVRFFDIRLKEYYGEYTIYHGLARYDMTFNNFLKSLNELRNNLGHTDDCIIMVTYEGEMEDYDEYPFYFYIKSFFDLYPTVKLGNVSVKKPEWKTIFSSPYHPNYIQNYPKIVGWKMLFPFPKIWNLFKKKVKSDGYVMEDFV